MVGGQSDNQMLAIAKISSMIHILVYVRKMIYQLNLLHLSNGGELNMIQ